MCVEKCTLDQSISEYPFKYNYTHFYRIKDPYSNSMHRISFYIEMFLSSGMTTGFLFCNIAKQIRQNVPLKFKPHLIYIWHPDLTVHYVNTQPISKCLDQGIENDMHE